MPAEIDARPSLTAEPERFSDAAWDLLIASQEQARRWRHDQMDVEHTLQVLFSDRRYAGWIAPLQLNLDALLDQLDDFCPSSPAAAPVSCSSARRWRICWSWPIASVPAGDRG